MVLLVLEPVIVSHKLIKVEAISLVATLAQKNLQEDLTQTQELIQIQAQLKQVLEVLAELLEIPLVVYHRHQLSQRVLLKRKPLQPKLVKNQKKPVMLNQKGMS
jgi:hypothetical protein